MFLALRKTLEHSTVSRALIFFLRVGNNHVLLKKSIEYTESLLTALFDSDTKRLNYNLFTKFVCAYFPMKLFPIELNRV